MCSEDPLVFEDCVCSADEGASTSKGQENIAGIKDAGEIAALPYVRHFSGYSYEGFSPVISLTVS